MVDDKKSDYNNKRKLWFYLNSNQNISQVSPSSNPFQCEFLEFLKPLQKFPDPKSMDL